MKDDSKNTQNLGFCTFCMGQFTPSRMPAHLRRCSCRVDDGYATGMANGERPMAFLFKVSAEGQPDVWMMLEAHCETRFSAVAEEVLRLWFPNAGYTGAFSLKKRVRGRRAKQWVPLDGDPRLAERLKLKDALIFSVTDGKTNLDTRLEVTGHRPTAIMHRPVDLVAFPLDRSRSSVAVSPVASHVETLSKVFGSRRHVVR